MTPWRRAGDLRFEIQYLSFMSRSIMQLEIICDSPHIITNGKNENKEKEEMTT